MPRLLFQPPLLPHLRKVSHPLRPTLHHCYPTTTVPTATSPTATMPIATAPTTTTKMSLPDRRGRAWVSASAMHNALLRNHLLDVLDVHGPTHGLSPDSSHPTSASASAGAHTPRMRTLSAQFRRQVTGALARAIGRHLVECVCSGSANLNVPCHSRATAAAMRRGAPLIVGAVLADERSRLHALVPILLRVDVARDVLGWCVELPCEGEGGQLVDLAALYVAVGVKRKELRVTPDGIVKPKTVQRIVKEMWVWNRLLARMQGCDIGTALLIGLRPGRGKATPLGAWPNPHNDRGAVLERVFNTSIWQLAEVPCGGEGCPRGTAAMEALLWRTQVVDEGADWIEAALKKVCGDADGDYDGDSDGHSVSQGSRNGIQALAAVTTDERLRPNMKCESFYDWPWAKAKRQLAEQLREVTLVYGVSQQSVALCISNRIPNDYAHALATGDALGVTNERSKTILEMCKPGYDGPSVIPHLIAHNYSNWRNLQGYKQSNPLLFDKAGPQLPFAEQVTFYVDFELASPDNLLAAPSPGNATCDVMESRTASTLTDMGDEQCRYFDVLPVRPLQDCDTGTNLIFMIGCGQLIENEWRHRVFIAQSLTIEGESGVVREWLEYMHSAIPADCGLPVLNVWGPEKSYSKEALRRMTPKDKAAVKEIKNLKTVNVLDVITRGGVTIKGSLTNNLKAVYSSLESLGLLKDFEQRSLTDIVSNGADAMALGLQSAEDAISHNLGSLAEAPKMDEIARYNEADCREVALVVTYLRHHH